MREPDESSKDRPHRELTFVDDAGSRSNDVGNIHLLVDAKIPNWEYNNEGILAVYHYNKKHIYTILKENGLDHRK